MGYMYRCTVSQFRAIFSIRSIKAFARAINAFFFFFFHNPRPRLALYRLTCAVHEIRPSRRYGAGSAIFITKYLSLKWETYTLVPRAHRRPFGRATPMWRTTDSDSHRAHVRITRAPSCALAVRSANPRRNFAIQHAHPLIYPSITLPSSSTRFNYRTCSSKIIIIITMIIIIIVIIIITVI